MTRVFIVGDFSTWASAIESSYARALQGLGCEIHCFEINQAIARNCRYGRPGRVFNQFVPVDAWLRKANREMVVELARVKSHLMLVIGAYRVQPGALAQAVASGGVKTALVWPDTLSNLPDETIACAPLYEIVSTYSRASVPLWQRLGAAKAAWLPLAGDPSLFETSRVSIDSGSVMQVGVTFIGGWRPEREALLSKLAVFDLKIWGPDWGRRCKNNRAIMKAWQGNGVYGMEFARVTRSSKINLNIIDPTNYPAANMRFFEIPTAGGLQVCSPCPEMEDEFRHGEHIFYYQHSDDLPDLLRSLLADDALRAKVAAAAHEKVLAAHTYTHRARRLLEILDLTA